MSKKIWKKGVDKETQSEEIETIEHKGISDYICEGYMSEDLFTDEFLEKIAVYRDVTEILEKEYEKHCN